MDETPFSQTRAMDTATILKRFPAADQSEVARLIGMPAQLTAYLARSNDLTQLEAKEGLTGLPVRLLPNAEESALRAA